MATIHTGADEYHVVHHDDDASASSMIAVLLIAAVLIIGFLLFAMRALPFAGQTGSDIDVDLPNITTPDTTPNVNVEQQQQVPAPGTTPDQTNQY